MLSRIHVPLLLTLLQGMDYRCVGVPGVVSELEWEQVKNFATNWHIPDVFICLCLPIFVTLIRGLSAVLQDCLPGVLVVILNALPAIDFEFGKGKAGEWLMMAKALATKYINSSQSVSSWEIQLDDLGPHIDILLGVAEHRPPCAQDLKVHVISPHPRSDGSLFCGNHGQWAIEALIPAWFAESACHVNEASAADFVILADHRTCHHHLNCEGAECQSQVIPNQSTKGRRAELLLTAAEELTQPWSRRLMILADQGLRVNFSHIAPGWKDSMPSLQQSVFLTTEPYTSGEFPSVFSLPYKDIVVPGSISPARLRALKAASRPVSERDLLLSFHGRLPGNHRYYQNNTIRRVAENSLAGVPDLSIGGIIDNFFDIKGKSKFCLIMPGTSNWSNHLYESLFSGCVPVIVGDSIVPAFDYIVDWTQTAIRWSEARFLSDPLEMIESLRSLTATRVEQLQRNVINMGCWFDYTRVYSSSCSPYVAIVRGLSIRAAVRSPASWR
ncbi:hypothetical protein FOL47_007952 [Perkinsus chesapeaki]|uniref:Exostosin GT47 domain-containing protein n=1 Tax=Perkinsus chesapeaki TaxID=330153 RepID=A0A7J6MUZ5_PERCH|nr:hypothetical protein FOL47_007952 [Perkinsus chesapeaki]